jgi:hypothetical protein
MKTMDRNSKDEIQEVRIKVEPEIKEEPGLQKKSAKKRKAKPTEHNGEPVSIKVEIKTEIKEENVIDFSPGTSQTVAR